MSELVEGLYLNTEAEVYLKASCQGSYGPKGEKLGCAGSATVKHKFLEARKQVAFSKITMLNMVSWIFSLLGSDRASVNIKKRSI